MLDADYRPLTPREDGTLRDPVRPRFPTRYRAWMYAMAATSAIMDGRMKETTGSAGRGR